MDLSLLKDRNTIGLNKIYLMVDKVDLNLTYHVAVIPLVIQQSVQEFEALLCPSFLAMRPSHRVIKHSPNIYKICTTDAPLLFQENASKVLCEGFTVTFVAMQIAFFMGFKKVYLIGIDHSFVSDGKPNERQKMAGSDPNHFSPLYFGGQDWHLPDLEGSEVAYRLAKFYFERDNRLIYDATVGGKLDVFPKVSFGEALAMSGR